jgi:hypothetical protein
MMAGREEEDTWRQVRAHQQFILPRGCKQIKL